MKNRKHYKINYVITQSTKYSNLKSLLTDFNICIDNKIISFFPKSHIKQFLVTPKVRFDKVKGFVECI